MMKLYFKFRKRCSLGFKSLAGFRCVRLIIPRSKLMMTAKIMSRFTRRISRCVLLAALVVIGISSSLSIIIGQQQIPSTFVSSVGKVKVERVGVYWDNNCSIAVEYLDWGTLEPGSAQNFTVYIRNEGNRDASLFLVTENWNPSNATDFLSFNWNYDGTMLGPMDAIEVIGVVSVSRCGKHTILQL